MLTVNQIEAAIKELSAEDVNRLDRWFTAYRNRLWDERMDEDAAAGRLIYLFEEAEAEYEAEHLRDWPPSKYMKSKATRRFWRLHNQLPGSIQHLAVQTYRR